MELSGEMTIDHGQLIEEDSTLFFHVGDKSSPWHLEVTRTAVQLSGRIVCYEEVPSWERASYNITFTNNGDENCVLEGTFAKASSGDSTFPCSDIFPIPDNVVPVFGLHLQINLEGWKPSREDVPMKKRRPSTSTAIDESRLVFFIVEGKRVSVDREKLIAGCPAFVPVLEDYFENNPDSNEMIVHSDIKYADFVKYLIVIYKKRQAISMHNIYAIMNVARALSCEMTQQACTEFLRGVDMSHAAKLAIASKLLITEYEEELIEAISDVQTILDISRNNAGFSDRMKLHIMKNIHRLIPCNAARTV